MTGSPGVPISQAGPLWVFSNSPSTVGVSCPGSSSHGAAFCSSKLWFSILGCLSLPVLERRVCLQLNLSARFEKNFSFFSLFCLLLPVRMEWQLLNYLHARPETRNLLYSFLTYLISLWFILDSFYGCIFIFTDVFSCNSQWLVLTFLFFLLLIIHVVMPLCMTGIFFYCISGIVNFAPLRAGFFCLFFCTL
jgi:hypothetical protein